MVRQRVALTGTLNDVKEEWYYTGVALLRPVNVMIGDTHPAEHRERTLSNGAPNPQFSAEVASEYHLAYSRAQNFLKEQRNKVNDRHLPRFQVFKVTEAPGESRAARELHGLLIDGALDRLYENLVAYSPLLVAEKYVKAVQETLDRVYPLEAKRLGDYLVSPGRGYYYKIEYADGVYPIETNLDAEDIEFETTPRLHPNHPSLRTQNKE